MAVVGRAAGRVSASGSDCRDGMAEDDLKC